MIRQGAHALDSRASPPSWGPSHLPRVGSLHTYFTCIMVETEYAASTLVERQGVGPQPDGPSNE